MYISDTPYYFIRRNREFRKPDLLMSDVHLVLADLAAFRGRMHTLIRASKLAALHKPEKMLHVRM